MATKIGFAASLERIDPLTATRMAAFSETQGFSGVLATDHFQPWLSHQAQSSFVWSVLGALGTQTTGRFGPGMTVPGYRMHPVVIAQAAATLAQMFPERFWLSLGIGEAINETVMAKYWPDPSQRADSLFEALELIKKLFHASAHGRDLRFKGTFFEIEPARLWGLPEKAPAILVTTSGLLTARKAGRFADGILTMGSSYEHTAQVLERFRIGAKEAGKSPDDMLKILHLQTSWAETDAEAARIAVAEWPIGGMKFLKSDIRSPKIFDQIAKSITESDLEGVLPMSADSDVHIKYIQRYVDLGFDHIYVNNVNPDIAGWIIFFGSNVLPKINY